ncbi:App1 family protein [soil metagenome]
MPIKKSVRMIGRGLRGALRLAGKPVRRRESAGGLVIQPYRGYGTREQIYLMGRVFRQPQFGKNIADGTLLRDVADVARRLTRWGRGDAKLIARYDGSECRTTTDKDGYFRVHLHLDQTPPIDRLWHQVELEVSSRGDRHREKAEVFIPPATARFVVISDIDDTVMYTGVVNKAKMLYRLFVQDADSRVAFPGVGALYRALHDGKNGDEQNPMLYVSRAPWSIYEVLERFFQTQQIPLGPVLFLREWGLTLQRPFPKRASSHKRDLIEDMLARYTELPFILIGDSGQHDPEVYAKVVAQHPERVLAVYIRNVSKPDSRIDEIKKLADEVARAGSTLVLASDSEAMAKHAAEHGWIAADRIAEVIADDTDSELHEDSVEEHSPEGVEKTLSESEHSEAPPNVVMEGPG